MAIEHEYRSFIPPQNILYPQKQISGYAPGQKVKGQGLGGITYAESVFILGISGGEIFPPKNLKFPPKKFWRNTITVIQSR